MIEANRSEIKEFFRILFNGSTYEGYQGIFTKDDLKTTWKDPKDFENLIETVATLTVKGEVHYNVLLHDLNKAKEDYRNRNPDKNDSYARGTNKSAKVAFGAFIDIDVSCPGHSQTDLPLTIEVGIAFLKGLPIKISLFVLSGGGIHAYVLFDKPFNIENDNDRRRIQNLFSKIQKLVKEEGLKNNWKLDNVGDLARMARIPGTFNWKIPNKPRQVKILEYDENSRCEVETLEAFFDELQNNKCITLPQKNNNIEQLCQLSQMELIYEKCKWFRYTVDDSDKLTEPEWKAQIDITCRCKNGRIKCHELSSNYNGYSENETEQKIDRSLVNGGPRTCLNIIELAGEQYCLNCEHYGKIKSPIQLGYPDKSNINKEELIKKVDDIISRIKSGDMGLHLEKDSINAFSRLLIDDPPEYARKYNQLIKTKISISTFKREVNQAANKARNEAIRLKTVNGLENDMPGTFNPILVDSPYAQAIIPNGYLLEYTGVYKVSYDKDGNERRVQITFKPFIISRKLKDIDDGREQVELTWKDSTWRTTIVDRDAIANTRKIVDLAIEGFPVHSLNSGDIVIYLAEFEAINDKNMPCEMTTSRLGWQGDGVKNGFLLGNKLITDGTDKTTGITFRPLSSGDNQIANAFRLEGSFEVWKEAVSQIKGYASVEATLYASFAPVLQEILGCSNFGYELACKTSKGKTTCQRIGASVWGDPDERHSSSVIQSWNNTKVFIERAASMLNGLPLFLDDTKQAKTPELVAETIYMVANGRGRGRADLKGIAFTKTIKTVLISTAEVPSVNLTRDGGTKGRFIEVTTKPFDNYIEFINPSITQFITNMNQQVKSNFGHAGPMFVEYVMKNKDKWSEWKKMFRDKEAEYANKPGNSELAGRLAEYAAIIYVSGKLAHEAVSLPWEFKDPFETLWPVVISESVDPTGGVNCLLTVISWAYAHQKEFATNDEKRAQPVGGWLGKWDSSSNWNYIAFIPSVLQKLIKDAGYEQEAMMRDWLDSNFLDVNTKDNRHKFIKQVKLIGSNAWLYVIRRDAINKLMSSESCD